VLLTDQLKKMCSPNHGARGQNVLYCDGSVEYVKQRIVNGDDIFTIRGVEAYTGTEMPLDENDIFLVP
jgi:prepilin-type processing-associated H-X9-DG protein